MRSGRLQARLDRLVFSPGLGRIVVIYPDAWCPQAQAAYDAACLAADTEGQAAVIAQATGEVVGLTNRSAITVIEIRERVDGPV